MKPQWGKKITVLSFVGIASMAALMVLAGCQYKTHNNTLLPMYVGTYDPSISDGVYRMSVNTETGEFTPSEKVIDAQSPSFLAQSKRDVLYAVERADDGVLAAYKKADNDKFVKINSVLTEGASPCYIAFSPDQTLVATANYTGGNVSVFGLKTTGEIQQSPLIIAHKGRSVTDRQKSPHAHWVKWSPWQVNTLYAVDLGADNILQHTISADGKRVVKSTIAHKAKAGAGPRHLVFHPTQKRVYILNELDNTLVVASVKSDGVFEVEQRISTLPSDFDQHNQAGHIEISQDGKHVYTSNRGHDSLAHFTLDSKGQATFVNTVSTEGNWPRYFSLLDEHGLLIVANRQSHSVVSYKVSHGGHLVPTGYKGEVKWPSYIEPATL